MKTITFYYRGLIERGADYHWTEGWSAKGSTGGVLYPWSTKRECQSEAKSKRAKAVFVREEDKPRDYTSHTEAINAANQPDDIAASNQRQSDYYRNAGGREFDSGGKDRDEWRHEAAAAQRLK